MSQTTVLKLSSVDRELSTSKSTSDFVVNIRNGKRLDRLKGLTIKSIALKNNFDNVNEYNNTFTFYDNFADNIQVGVNDRLVIDAIPEDAKLSPVVEDIIITAGHYHTIDLLIDELNTQLTNYTVTSYQGKIRITRTDGLYRFTFDTDLTTSFDVLGYTTTERKISFSQTADTTPAVNRIHPSFTEEQKGIVVTVPIGFYNINTFISALQTGFTNSTYTGTVIVTSETNTKIKMVFSTEVAFYGSQLLRIGEPSGISEILGFASGSVNQYESDSNSVDNDGKTYYAPNYPNLQGPTMITIHSRALSPINGLDANGISNNILIGMPMDVQHLATEYLTSNSPRIDNVLYKSARNVDSVDIRLRDEYGRAVNNYGGNITLLMNLFY